MVTVSIMVIMYIILAGMYDKLKRLTDKHNELVNLMQSKDARQHIINEKLLGIVKELKQ